MAFIEYRPESDVPPEHRVPDQDRIIQVHSVHSAVIRQHYALYVELMHRAGPLSRVQREMVAVVVSATNGCHY